jgi:hypothetical protein
MVRRLLDLGAPVDAPTNDGKTALFCAVQRGHLQPMDEEAASRGAIVPLGFARGPLDAVMLRIDNGRR